MATHKIFNMLIKRRKISIYLHITETRPQILSVRHKDANAHKRTLFQHFSFNYEREEISHWTFIIYDFAWFCCCCSVGFHTHTHTERCILAESVPLMTSFHCRFIIYIFRFIMYAKFPVNSCWLKFWILSARLFPSYCALYTNQEQCRRINESGKFSLNVRYVNCCCWCCVVFCLHHDKYVKWKKKRQQPNWKHRSRILWYLHFGMLHIFLQCTHSILMEMMWCSNYNTLSHPADVYTRAFGCGCIYWP